MYIKEEVFVNFDLKIDFQQIKSYIYAAKIFIMKKFILFCGVILILPWHATSQDVEYLTEQDFQVEKARLLESIYRTNKANKDLQDKLYLQAASIDSLAHLLALHKEDMMAQQDSLNQLQSYQSDLDSRLVTQRKSGTLIAILIPAGLFLFFLILLIWLIVLRNRTLAQQKSLEEEIEKSHKQVDDLTISCAKDQSAIKEQINSSFSGLENRFDAFSKEMEEKVKKLEQYQQEEKIAHDTMHKEAHAEVEKFKTELQKGYSLISNELGKFKEESAVIIKQTKDHLLDVIAKKMKE